MTIVAGDSNKNAEVRRALQPLVNFADRAQIALIGITHFSKGTERRAPLDRVPGSVAFGALARIVFATARARKEDGGRVLVRVKSNIGPDGGGFRYELRQNELDGKHRGIIASHVEWGATITGSAREILAGAERHTDADEPSERSEAAGWLHHRIADAGGELDRQDALKDAKSAGFAERTVDRAKVDAGVRVRQIGFGSESVVSGESTEAQSRLNPANPATHKRLADMAGMARMAMPVNA